MKIFTHENIGNDLDAICSVWALRRYWAALLNGCEGIFFKPANWNGEGMKKNDQAVCIAAGGKGFQKEVETKRDKEEKRSCFAHLMETGSNMREEAALDWLIALVHSECFGEDLPIEITSNRKKMGFIRAFKATRQTIQKSFTDDANIIEYMSRLITGNATQEFGQRSA